MIKVPKWVNGIFVGTFFFFTIHFFVEGNYIMSAVDFGLFLMNIGFLASKD